MHNAHRAFRCIRLVLLAIAPLTSGAAASDVSVEPPFSAQVLSVENASHFLRRLMRAESGGRDLARNPRSSALGAFQFIRSTFLDVTRRHFTEEVELLSEAEILELRTNREFSRRAALAYTNENAAYLAERGIEPTLARLRLAYLLGAAGAARLLEAPADRPVSQVFESAVVRANPFMKRMKVADLIAKAEREMQAPLPEGEPKPVATKVKAASREAAPASRLLCKPQLASCRKAMALEQRRRARQAAQRGGAPTG